MSDLLGRSKCSCTLGVIAACECVCVCVYSGVSLNFTPAQDFAIRKTRMIKKMKDGEKAGGNPEERGLGIL